jgi:hypothetical protein
VLALVCRESVDDQVSSWNWQVLDQVLVIVAERASAAGVARLAPQWRWFATAAADAAAVFALQWRGRNAE